MDLLPPAIEGAINRSLSKPAGELPGPEWDLPDTREELQLRARGQILGALATDLNMERAVAMAMRQLDSGTEGLDEWVQQFHDDLIRGVLSGSSIRK